MINNNYYVVIEEYSHVIIVVGIVIFVMALPTIHAKNHPLLQRQMIYICCTVIIPGTGTGIAISRNKNVQRIQKVQFCYLLLSLCNKQKIIIINQVCSHSTRLVVRHF